MVVTKTTPSQSEAFWFDGIDCKSLSDFLIGSEKGELRHILFEWRYDPANGIPFLVIAEQSKSNPPCQLCFNPRGWHEIKEPCWIVVTGSDVTWGNEEWFKANYK